MATNKWTKWDEAAEFAIKVGPLSILFTCMAIAVAGMAFDKEYPEIVDDLAKVGSGALAPFSIKGIKELLAQEEKNGDVPAPPPTEPTPINPAPVPPPDSFGEAPFNEPPVMGFGAALVTPVPQPRFTHGYQSGCWARGVDV